MKKEHVYEQNEEMLRAEQEGMSEEEFRHSLSGRHLVIGGKTLPSTHFSLRPYDQHLTKEQSAVLYAIIKLHESQSVAIGFTDEETARIIGRRPGEPFAYDHLRPGS